MGLTNKFGDTTNDLANSINGAVQEEDKAAGLYQNGVMIKSWDQLIDEGLIYTTAEGFWTNNNGAGLVGDELVISDTVSAGANSVMFKEADVKVVTVPDGLLIQMDREIQVIGICTCYRRNAACRG